MIKQNNDEVICPKCCHQFRAIPVNIQNELATANKRIRELAGDNQRLAENEKWLLEDLTAEREVSDKLEKALRIVGQSLAWKAFGECRSFGENVLLMAPADADKFAHAALAEVAAIRSKGE